MELGQSRAGGAGRAGTGRRAARAAALVAALALVATGCGGGGGTATPPAPAPAGEPSAAAEGAFPVTVKDKFGDVEITAQPARVAALTMSDADVLVALGVTPVLFESPSWVPNGINPWLSDALAGAPAPEGFDAVDSL